MALFHELMGKARDGTITQKEIETLNRLQSLIDYIHQKQEKESETWQKAIKERAAEKSKRQDIGNELRRTYGMTDEQRGIYDKLKGLVDKLNNSDLTNKEKHSILGKEIGKMVNSAIRGTADSIAAGKVSGLKDFKFTDYSGVQVDTLKEIQRQGKIAEKQLTTE